MAISLLGKQNIMKIPQQPIWKTVLIFSLLDLDLTLMPITMTNSQKFSITKENIIFPCPVPKQR